ncbi:MAG: metallophosphoesterase [Actinomycetota bacterium]|nr:metallophosphoesterase [Actinomycetota bacterium]
MLGLAFAVAALALGGQPATAPQPTRTLIAVGDVGACNSAADEETAKLVATLPGTIALLGDIAYEHGTDDEFARCYDPSWGRFKSRTRPAPGNHEYVTPGAAGYFRYFGPRAGPDSRGYYSYNLGAWHVVALNSNCSQAGGCAAGSAQERWLRADLRRSRAKCTLAYWHHPRFSSGLHGDDATVAPLWQALYDDRAELVLSGHDHDYERFMPQNANGVLDRNRGIRQIVVGTGGRSLYPILAGRPNSWIRNDRTYGVLRLTLAPGRYSFRFLPVLGGTFTDRGSVRCR